MTKKQLDSLTESRSNRRTILKAASVGATLTILGGVASANGTGRDNSADGTEKASSKESFGTPGMSDDNAPQNYDHEVEVFTDEAFLLFAADENGDPLGPVGIQFGMFGFDPVGLHVEPGDVVKFELSHPEHAVVNYHTEYGRQQRVPAGTPAFSSPFLDTGGFWLYRFETSGVYDVFCPPHEEFGMAMRLVVGDVTEPVVTAPGRPPAGLAGLLLDTAPLAPTDVVHEGTVAFDDAANATVTDPTDASSDTTLGELAIPLPEPTTADSLGKPLTEF